MGFVSVRRVQPVPVRVCSSVGYAGLDPVAALALKKKVRARREGGCTIVITSHNLGELESLAEDVVFLLEGRARFAGSLDSLLKETGRNTSCCRGPPGPVKKGPGADPPTWLSAWG